MHDMKPEKQQATLKCSKSKGSIDTDTLGKFILFVVILAVLIGLVIFLFDTSSSAAIRALRIPGLG